VKAAFFAVLGAILFGAAAYFLVDAIGYWYGRRFIQSDSDINDFVAGGLVFVALSIMAGAFAGVKVARRRRRI